MATKAARPKVTLEQFKEFAAYVSPFVRTVLLARIHAEETRKRVDAYIAPVFERFSFYVADQFKQHGGERITRPKDLYLCNDKALTDAYYEACDQAHRAHGFTGPLGHCPALVAEHLAITAENALIDMAQPLFGVDISDLWQEETRAKYLNLLIDAGVKAMD
jgi:hypothetical protein